MRLSYRLLGGRRFLHRALIGVAPGSVSRRIAMTCSSVKRFVMSSSCFVGGRELTSRVAIRSVSGQAHSACGKATRQALPKTYACLISATLTCEISGLKRSAPTFKLSLPRVGLTRRRAWQRVMADRLGRLVVARRAARLPAALEAPLGGRRPSLGCRREATATTHQRSADYGSISQAGGRGPFDGTGGG